MPCHSSHTSTCRVPRVNSETQWDLEMYTLVEMYRGLLYAIFIRAHARGVATRGASGCERVFDDGRRCSA